MNTKMTTERLGDLALHLHSFSEYPQAEWVKKFETPEEVEEVLEDNNNFLQVNPDRPKIRRVLNVLLNEMRGEAPEIEVTTETPDMGIEDLQLQPLPDAVWTGKPQANQEKGKTKAMPVQQQQQPQPQPQPQAVVSYSTAPEILTTDKGAIYHLGALRDKLESIYEEDEKYSPLSFNQACNVIDLDLTVDYISEASKKKLVKAIKNLLKEA